MSVSLWPWGVQGTSEHLDEKSKQLGEQSCQHGKGGLGTGDRRGKGQEEAQAFEVFGSKSGGAAMVWGQGHDGSRNKLILQRARHQGPNDSEEHSAGRAWGS